MESLFNFTENGPNGRFALRHGAALTLSHAFTNSGELIAGPAGMFTSEGYVQSGTAAIATIELAGAPNTGLYGQVEAGPSASLADAFQVAYRVGFVPAAQDSYEAMPFVNRSGNFDAFVGLFIGNTQVVNVIVNPNNVLINGLEEPELAYTLYLPVITKP